MIDEAKENGQRGTPFMYTLPRYWEGAVCTPKERPSGQRMGPSQARLGDGLDYPSWSRVKFYQIMQGLAIQGQLLDGSLVGRCPVELSTCRKFVCSYRVPTLEGIMHFI